MWFLLERARRIGIGKSDGSRATEKETSGSRATEKETSGSRATEECTKSFIEVATHTANKSIGTEKTSNSMHSLQSIHPFSAASEYLSMKKVLEFDQARKKPLGERQVLIGEDFDEVVFGHLDLTEESIEKIVALLSALRF